MICNNCKQTNPSGTYICKNCGHIMDIKQKVKSPIKNQLPVNNRMNAYNMYGDYNVEEYVEPEAIIQPEEQVPQHPYTQEVPPTYSREYMQKRQKEFLRKKNKTTPQMITTYAIIAIIAIIAVFIAINKISKIVEDKFKDSITSKPINTADNTGDNVKDDDTTFISEMQTMYEDDNILVTTDLSTAEVTDGFIELKLNITNNNTKAISLKITDIVVNSVNYYNNVCYDVVKIGGTEENNEYSNSLKEHSMKIQLDRTIIDEITTIEMKFQINTLDHTSIIETDTCMINDFNTGAPIILQAYTNINNSVRETLNSDTSNTIIDTSKEKQRQIGINETGFITVFGDGWQVTDDTGINNKLTTDNSISYQLSAVCNTTDNVKTLYILSTRVQSDDIELTYSNMINSIDALAIGSKTSNINGYTIKYNIETSDKENTFTALILNAEKGEIITIMYGANTLDKEKFITDVKNMLYTYSKLNLTGLEL